MTTPDEVSLDGFDYRQLEQLAERVAGRMQTIRDEAAKTAPDLKAKFEQECLARGLTLEELCNGTKPRKRRSTTKPSAG